MAAPEQKGEAVEIGVGAYLYAGYIEQGVTIKPTADVRKIKISAGTVTRIILDKGKELKLSMITKLGTDPTLIAIGDVITVNGVNYCVDDVDVNKVEAEEEKVDLTVSKEDNMTYTP